MKWEYKGVVRHPCHPIVNNASVESSLNKLGEDGWELVSSMVVDGFLCFYFKRQKQ